MDQLLETIASERPESGPYRNYYFQPERIQISSESDQNTQIGSNPNQECFYKIFSNTLPRPALEVKSIQLVRASIPNPQTCIPDEETTFWYYRIPKEAFAPFIAPELIFTRENLHMVRLLPSWYKPELNPNSPLYGFNQTFPDYQALNDELKKSCLNDPLGDYAPYNPSFPLFSSGDISLIYDPVSNKFKFDGNNVYVDNVYTWVYISAGYLDPVVQQAQRDLVGFSQEFDSYGPYPPQAFQLYKTLNLRLGFTWDGANRNLYSIGGTATSSGINDVLAYRFRPFVSFVQPAPPSPNLGDLYDPNEIASDYTYTAETYANLVYTNCVNVYCSFISGATTDSLRNTQLLAAVPMNAQNLGITFYNPVISNPLTKILDQIYQISVELFTDTGAPYSLPNSAVVSLELALTY